MYWRYLHHNLGLSLSYRSCLKRMHLHLRSVVISKPNLVLIKVFDVIPNTSLLMPRHLLGALTRYTQISSIMVTRRAPLELDHPVGVDDSLNILLHIREAHKVSALTLNVTDHIRKVEKSL